MLELLLSLVWDWGTWQSMGGAIVQKHYNFLFGLGVRRRNSICRRPREMTLRQSFKRAAASISKRTPTLSLCLSLPNTC